MIPFRFTCAMLREWTCVFVRLFTAGVCTFVSSHFLSSALWWIEAGGSSRYVAQANRNWITWWWTYERFHCNVVCLQFQSSKKFYRRCTRRASKFAAPRFCALMCRRQKREGAQRASTHLLYGWLVWVKWAAFNRFAVVCVLYGQKMFSGENSSAA